MPAAQAWRLDYRIVSRGDRVLDSTHAGLASRPPYPKSWEDRTLYSTHREGHELADVDICRLPSGSTRCGFLHIVRPPDLSFWKKWRRQH